MPATPRAPRAGPGASRSSQVSYTEGRSPSTGVVPSCALPGCVLAKAGVRSRAGRFCTAHTAESDPPERCPTIQQYTMSGSVAHMIKTETREMTTKQCMDL